LERGGWQLCSVTVLLTIAEAAFRSFALCGGRGRGVTCLSLDGEGWEAPV
jgi:hypothetical protein